MSTHNFGMGEPGYTLTVGTTAEAAGQWIAHTFVADGFRRKSAPGVFPVKLTYSSVGASICIEVFSSVVPIFLVPTFFRKMLPLKAKIRVLQHSAESCTLRVDMDSVSSTAFTFPIFDKALRRGVAALTDQGIWVKVGPLTDSVLETRHRRKKR